MPRPPDARAESTPWPTYPLMYRVSSAHEEGGERVFSVNTEEFVGKDGHVTALKVHEVTMQDGKFVKIEGSDFELEADLVLLAMGFVGPEKPGLLTDLGVKLTDRGNVARGARLRHLGPGVFVAGDMGRGQSLIVWAIAEGRAAAAGVDRYLMGSTALPAPVKPTAAPLSSHISHTQKHRYICRRVCRCLPDGGCLIARCGLHHRCGVPVERTDRRSDHCAYINPVPRSRMGANRLVMVSPPGEEPRISR